MRHTHQAMLLLTAAVILIYIPVLPIWLSYKYKIFKTFTVIKYLISR